MYLNIHIHTKNFITKKNLKQKKKTTNPQKKDHQRPHTNKWT